MAGEALARAGRFGTVAARGCGWVTRFGTPLTPRVHDRAASAAVDPLDRPASQRVPDPLSCSDFKVRREWGEAGLGRRIPDRNRLRRPTRHSCGARGGPVMRQRVRRDAE